MVQKLIDKAHPVAILPPVALTGTAQYVNMGKYSHLSIVLTVNNGAAPTGSDVSLLQAQDVSGTGAKALAFTRVFRALDVANADETLENDVLEEVTVASDTFATDATANQAGMYVIEIEAADLDVNEGFTSVQLVNANGADIVLSANAQMGNPSYPERFELSAIID